MTTQESVTGMQAFRAHAVELLVVPRFINIIAEELGSGRGSRLDFIIEQCVKAQAEAAGGSEERLTTIKRYLASAAIIAHEADLSEELAHEAFTVLCAMHENPDEIPASYGE